MFSKQLLRCNIPLWQTEPEQVFDRLCSANKLARRDGSSDGVLRLGLEARLETHFCESRSRWFQVSLSLEGYRSRDFEYYKEMV